MWDRAASRVVSVWEQLCSVLALCLSAELLHRRVPAPSEHLLISRDLFLKILTSVLNRFHSVPLHRVDCQLLSSAERSRGNLLKDLALHKDWIQISFFFSFLYRRKTCFFVIITRMLQLLFLMQPLFVDVAPSENLITFSGNVFIDVQADGLCLCSISPELTSENSLCSLCYLHGLLEFHRHLGIPYMPRQPITHLQTDGQWETPLRSISGGDLFSDENNTRMQKVSFGGYCQWPYNLSHYPIRFIIVRNYLQQKCKNKIIRIWPL